jgi:uncharacterized membrane protein YeaQ/YmgE (transglycosylase-associated protein family)
MTLETFATWIFVGLLTGWLARIVWKDGGGGLVSDLVLGLGGSGAASGIFSTVAASPDAGRLTTVAVAFIGAAIAIAGQRKVLYGHR